MYRFIYKYLYLNILVVYNFKKGDFFILMTWEIWKQMSDKILQ